MTETAWHAQRLLEEIPFFDPELKVHLFPDWETLPYDHFSPHHDLVSERLATLYQMMHGEFDVAIVAVTTALCRLPPVEYLAGHTFFFKQGEKLEAHELRRQLTLAGYTHVTQVVAPGEYSFRGGLIDLFPMGSAVPYRIDLFDEEIDSIRSFDVDTQRSIYKVNEVRLLPAREFPMDEAAQTRFRKAFRETFEGDPSKSRIYKDVSKGIPTAGIEYYLPLFFERTASLTDYLPEATTVCVYPGLEPAMQAFWDEANSRHGVLRGDLANPVLSPQALFLTMDQLFGALKSYPRVELDAGGESRETASGRREVGGDADAAGGERREVGGAAEGEEDAIRKAESPPLPAPGERVGVRGTSTTQGTASTVSTTPLPPLAVERRADDPLHRIRAFVEHFDGRVLLVAESPGRRETMLEYFAEYALRPVPVSSYRDFLAAPERLMLTVGPLHGGFVLERNRFALVTEDELYATQVRTRTQRETRRATSEYMLRDLSEVKVGDPVVHEQHGIGRYLGLQSMNLGEGETEFLTLEYAGNDKLYVPVSNLHLISRYSGAAPDQAPLHTLGQRTMGEGEAQSRRTGARHRRGAPQSLRPACLAQGARVRAEAARLRSVQRELPLRRDSRSGRGDQCDAGGSEERQADGPARVRRRRFRQDRSRIARGFCRGRGRQTGRGARADNAARGAALQHVFRPLRGLAGEDRGALALSLGAGTRRSAERHRGRTHRHCDRHAQARSGERSASRTWAWSSSTRNTASACGRRSG